MQITKTHVLFNEEERRLYNIVETFCDTLIASTLKGDRDSKRNEKLLSLLQDPDIKIRTGRKSPDATTFGDFAVLISDPAEPQEEDSDQAYDAMVKYFTTCELFFACFEQNAKDSMPQSVRDFMDMPFDTFFRFAELCGTLPMACTKLSKAYNTKGKTVAELYREMEDAALNSGKTDIVSMILLFACPLAMIQLFPCE